MATFWSPTTKLYDSLFHGNPLNPRWNLADEPQDYKYSSAGFYYTGKDELGFLENYMEVLNDTV